MQDRMFQRSVNLQSKPEPRSKPEATKRPSATLMKSLQCSGASHWMKRAWFIQKRTERRGPRWLLVWHWHLPLLQHLCCIFWQAVSFQATRPRPRRPDRLPRQHGTQLHHILAALVTCLCTITVTRRSNSSSKQQSSVSNTHSLQPMAAPLSESGFVVLEPAVSRTLPRSIATVHSPAF